MNKIVELIINMEEFEFEDLGVEILSLVDKPAIEVNWMAFSEDMAEFRENPDCPDGFEHEMPDGTWMCGKEHNTYNAKFVDKIPGESEDAYIGRCIPQLKSEGYDDDQAAAICYSSFSDDNAKKQFNEHVLKIARSSGEVIDPESVIYIDGRMKEFATVADYLDGARALNALEDLDPSTPAEMRYRYAGPAGQRTFCATLKALNRTYSREDITRMNRFNPGFGPRGSNSYSVFEYKGGPNCNHYWESMVKFNNGTRDVLVSLGPAAGDAGETNNSSEPSPDGSVSNNAYLMSKHWSFSTDDQMIVTGPAMIPLALIPRKDELGNTFHVYFSKDTVQKIAKKFLEDNNTHNTDINHDDNIVNENTLLESWIVQNPDMDKSKDLGFDVPSGTWMISYKINNEETWNQIKAGELNGFSVTGNFLEIVQKN